MAVKTRAADVPARVDEFGDYMTLHHVKSEGLPRASIVGARPKIFFEKIIMLDLHRIWDAM